MRRPLEGCDRVCVDAARIDDDLRRGALQGKTLVVQKSRRHVVGAHYVVRSAAPDAQFDELLGVLGERDAVASWGSRCGIC